MQNFCDKVTIVKDSGNKIYSWALNNLEQGYYPNTLTIGVMLCEKMVAGIIFSLEKHNVYLSIYSTTPKWCSKKVLKFIYNCAFNTLKAKVMTALISQANTKSQKLVKGIGFSLNGTIKHGRADGSDCLIYQCFAKEYKYK